MEPDRKHGGQKDRLVSLDITFCSLLNIEYICPLNQTHFNAAILGRDWEFAKVATRELISLSKKREQCLIFFLIWSLQDARLIIIIHLIRYFLSMSVLFEFVQKRTFPHLKLNRYILGFLKVLQEGVV